MPDPQDPAAGTPAAAQAAVTDQDVPEVLRNLPKPPPIPGGRELYDSIMGEIEPELTTAGLLALPQTYVNETPDQKRGRAKRYNDAFEEYGRRFQAYNVEWMGQFTTFQRQALKSVEHIDRETDDQANEALYSKIQQAA